jgi:hypothetical protein
VAASAAQLVLFAVALSISIDAWRPAPVRASPASAAPEPAVDPPAEVTSPPPEHLEVLPPFRRTAALAQLSRIDHTLATCRRPGGLWGTGEARVVFAWDGPVSQVSIGPPYRGTPEGDCVVHELSRAHVEPFAGNEAAVILRFFVPR